MPHGPGLDRLCKVRSATDLARALGTAGPYAVQGHLPSVQQCLKIPILLLSLHVLASDQSVASRSARLQASIDMCFGFKRSSPSQRLRPLACSSRCDASATKGGGKEKYTITITMYPESP